MNITTRNLRKRKLSNKMFDFLSGSEEEEEKLPKARNKTSKSKQSEYSSESEEYMNDSNNSERSENESEMISDEIQSESEDENSISQELETESDEIVSATSNSLDSEDSLFQQKKKKPKKKKEVYDEEEPTDVFDPPKHKKIQKIITSGKDNDGNEVFLVKFKNLSYHKCEWLDRETFMQHSLTKARLKSFMKKKDQLEDDQQDFSARFIFDPNYLQVDRVIHHRINDNEYVGFVDGVSNDNTQDSAADEINEMEDDEETVETDVFEKQKPETLVTSVTIKNGNKDREALLKRRDLSKCLRNYIESSLFEPEKTYDIFVEYLVKWRSLPHEECTWEKIDIAEEKNIERESKNKIENSEKFESSENLKREELENSVKEKSMENSENLKNSEKLNVSDNTNPYHITRFTKKKAIEKHLDKEKLRHALEKAAKLYEKRNDLGEKLKKMGLRRPPTSWKDPASVRSGRSPTLPGGETDFSKWQPPEYKGGNELKSPYQVEGVQWLIFNWHMKRNCILADEMGLGKTIQTIGFIDYLFKEQKLRGPFIIVSPKTTLQNWQREFEGWTDLNALTYDGSKESRDIIVNYEFYFDDEQREGKIINHVTKFDVIITSYGLVLSDINLLSQYDYGLMVVDEAHRLKNPGSKLYKALFEYTFQHCVLLTGTPLQNNIGELWALLSILEPTIFSSCEEFEKLYDTAEGSEDSAAKIGELHSKVLKPFMLRRVKNDVIDTLKPPKEVVIWLRLTREQKKYFKAIFEQNTDFLYASGRKNAPTLNNIYMQLRHCCNHPFVLRGVEERTRRERSLKSEAQVMEMLVNVSCKMDFLDKFLPMMKAQGHKVLIFSQFVMILDIIEDYLRWKGYSWERIDGSVDLDSRQNSIDRYNNDPNNFIFLLSTRSGGLGINLTSADTVIIYDSDWNPQNDLQAQARAHRIGQTKLVTVYRLVTKGSYEEIMFQKAGKKLGLEKALLHSWIQSGRDIEKGKSGNLNKEELEKLLKYGAYHVLRETDEDSKPQSIEEILASSEVVEMTDTGEKHDTIFSQATFMNTLDDNLSLDDPDFWRKIGLPKRNTNFYSYGRRRSRQHTHRRSPVVARPLSQQSDDESDDTDDESFESEDDSYWAREEKRSFEEAFQIFGYGRWEKIAEFTKSAKKLEELKLLGLNFIKLYVSHRGRAAQSFLKSLRGDVLAAVVEQLNKPFYTIDSAAADENSERGAQNDDFEIVENSVTLENMKLRRSALVKDVFELLDVLKLDSCLESQNWQEKRFSTGKTDEIKNLEFLWVQNTIIDQKWCEDKKTSKEMFDDSTSQSLPEKWWSPSHDSLLLRCSYDHGFDTKSSYDTFRVKAKELAPPSCAMPSETKLRKRLKAFLFKAKSRVINFHSKISKAAFQERVYNISQEINKSTAKLAASGGKAFNSAPVLRQDLRFQIPPPPHVFGLNSSVELARPTKVQARTFRRLVVTFPVRFPELASSWRFLTNPSLDRSGDLFSPVVDLTETNETKETNKSKETNKFKETDKLNKTKETNEMKDTKMPKIDVVETVLKIGAATGAETELVDLTENSAKISTGEQSTPRTPKDSESEEKDFGESRSELVSDPFFDYACLKSLRPETLRNMFLEFKKEAEEFESIEKQEKSGAMFEMTECSARKYKARLALFRSIFRVLELKDLDRALHSVRPFKYPTVFWKVPSSDKQLLQGIVKHGFGNWERMRGDKSLDSLFKNSSEALPKDSKVVLRLEQIFKDLLKTGSNSPSGPYTDAKNPLSNSKNVSNVKSAKQSGEKKSATSCFPFEVKTGAGTLKIHSFGKIVFDSPKWHTVKWIYPLGFLCVLVLDGDHKTSLTNEIVSSDSVSGDVRKQLKLGKTAEPVFKVTMFSSGRDSPASSPFTEQRVSENDSKLSRTKPTQTSPAAADAVRPGAKPENETKETSPIAKNGNHPGRDEKIKNFEKSEKVKKNEKNEKNEKNGKNGKMEKYKVASFHSLTIEGMLKKINKKLAARTCSTGKENTTIKGKDLFPIKITRVKKEIERLPDASLCEKYVVKHCLANEFVFSKEGLAFLQKRKGKGFKMKDESKVGKKKLEKKGGGRQLEISSFLKASGQSVLIDVEEEVAKDKRDLKLKSKVDSNVIVID